MMIHRDLSQKSPATVDECLEIVVAWIERVFGKDYFVGPLEEFQSRYGKVNSDDEFYQVRMNYFLEHCVLEKSNDGSTKNSSAAVTNFFEQNPDLTRGDDESVKTWIDFIGFRHSIYQVQKSGAELLVVKDLITERSFNILPKNGETLQYLNSKSIFQGFVFGNFTNKNLGQGLIVHPEAANQKIIKYINKRKSSRPFNRSDIFTSLAAANMRFLRMQHVDPAVIYGSLLS
jgi:hypothetical protein